MPAYNAERFLAEAIESVLAQTWQEFELIILNDGSTDSTCAIAESYARLDSRIKVESHINMGIAQTLNRGLELAANEWVARMDADDVMMPNRIERQLAFVSEHPDLAVASSWVYHINSNGNIIAKDNSPFVTHEAVQRRYGCNKLIGFNHPATIFRKRAVMTVGGYRRQFSPAEDVDLWNRMLEQDFKILVQPEYLLKYRLHGNSVSTTQIRMAYKKVGWVKECVQRRRRGESELPWEEFIDLRKNDPWFARINIDRKDKAKVFYKMAVSFYSQRRYYLVMLFLATALALQPIYTIRQVFSKLVLRADKLGDSIDNR